MQKDFHYYATYCAACLAGYTPEESFEIAWSAQFVDLCTETFLRDIKGPAAAATTQFQSELANLSSSINALQKVTRIWASFHFLPFDLNAEPNRKTTRKYKNKYRLICKPNGSLVKDTVLLAKKEKTLQAVGVAMHIVADTWAHAYFCGTPSLIINDTNHSVTEIREADGEKTEKRIVFRHVPGSEDDVENYVYSNSMYRSSENSIMNLGHGRMGHLPDYSYITYRYMPAWGDYATLLKENPKDYYHAFCQLVYAMKFLRDDTEEFSLDTYDEEAVAPWKEDIAKILVKRQVIACDDWRELGEKISGVSLAEFSLAEKKSEYLDAQPEKKSQTDLGRFFIAATAQKSMVTGKIFRSGSLLAGFSVEYDENKKPKGIKDYQKMAAQLKELMQDEQ